MMPRLSVSQHSFVDRKNPRYDGRMLLIVAVLKAVPFTLV